MFQDLRFGARMLLKKPGFTLIAVLTLASGIYAIRAEKPSSTQAIAHMQTTVSFLGVQGPWYTVGWQMSVVIEQAYGRARLIECICDQRKLLATYNQAAAKLRRQSRQPLAVWSVSLLNEIKRGKS